MKSKIVYVLFAALLMAACGQKKTEPVVSEETPVVQGLTEELKAAGWKLLFDGQSLSGWKFYQDKPNLHWEVIDGNLHCKPKQGEEANADILTIDQYTNFELAFEWKMSPGGNSGVMFRVTEDQDYPYFTGPEYQLIDDNGWPDQLKDEQRSGANYDMHAVSKPMVKPVGEWNSSKLLVNGNHVEHWLNGEKVVEYEIGSEDWMKRKAGSKWNEVASYGAQSSGSIDFQDHDHEAWFRNIMIRVL
jgi:hypothetical protein